MIVTTDVPKVPPILVSANTIATLSGKAATTLLIIVYLTKFKIILVTAAMTPMIMMLAIFHLILKTFQKQDREHNKQSKILK